MKNRLLTFIACGMISAAQAADVPSAPPFTWTDAVMSARAQNPEYKSAIQQAESFSARYKGSLNGVMPSVDLSNSYTESKNDTSATNRWGAQASASWDLFNLSQTADISSARASRDKSQWTLRSASAQVRLDLFRAFSGLLYTQNLIDVSQTILGIRSTNTKMVSLRYDSGRESKGNRLRSEAELLQAEMDVEQSKRDLKSSQQEFNRQLGRDRFDVVFATGSFNAQNPNEPDLEKLIESIPAVQQKVADLAIARAAVSKSKSALWPNLTARYTRSFSGQSEFPDQPNWTASGVLSLPLFGGGLTSTFYSIRESLNNRAAAEQDVRAARNQARSDLESAWANLQGSLDQLRVQESFLTATRQRNKEADVRYASGLITYDDWERIVTERINFEKSMIQARREAAVADAVWRQTQGLGLEDEL